MVPCQEHFSRVYKVWETNDGWIWGMRGSRSLARPVFRQCSVLWPVFSIQEISSQYLGLSPGESRHFHDSKLQRNGGIVIVKTPFESRSGKGFP